MRRDVQKPARRVPHKFGDVRTCVASSSAAFAHGRRRARVVRRRFLDVPKRVRTAPDAVPDGANRAGIAWATLADGADRVLTACAALLGGTDRGRIASDTLLDVKNRSNYRLTLAGGFAESPRRLSMRRQGEAGFALAPVGALWLLGRGMMKSLIGRVVRFVAVEKDVLLVFVASRLVLWIIAWLAVSSFQPGRPNITAQPFLWDILFRWDANWYARIVNVGYSYKPGAQSSAAFFPLLPLLAGALRQVTGMRVELAGFLVSNTALLGSAVLLRRLALLDFPPPSRVPQRAVWLLLFCPMTFFHSAFYAESLFLLLSLCVLFFARRRQWLGAGVAGALLTATRGNALLIGLPLLCEMFFAPNPDRAGQRQRWFNPSFGWLLLVPTGLVAFATFLHFRTGDALAFGHAQAAWGRHMDTPWAGISHTLAMVLPYRAFLLGAAVIAVALCVLNYCVHLRVSYQVYAAASVLLFISTSILLSLPRILSVIFPFYFAVAAVSERSENSFLLILATSAAMMALFAALFASGYPLV